MPGSCLEIPGVGDGKLRGDAVGEPGFPRDRAELTLAGDDAQDIGGNPGMKGELPRGRGHDLVGEVFPHGIKQLARRGAPVRRRSRPRDARGPRPASGGLGRGSRREQQQQQVPLLLANPAPDCRQLDGAVSPATRRMTSPAEPHRSGSSVQSKTSGTASPATRASLMARASRLMAPGSLGRPGGSRRSTNSARDPSAPMASKAHVSRDAPPDSRVRDRAESAVQRGGQLRCVHQLSVTPLGARWRR
jgi:hypothetical protein